MAGSSSWARRRIGAKGDRQRPQPGLVSRRPRARRRRRELRALRPRHHEPASGPCGSRPASGASSRGGTLSAELVPDGRRVAFWGVDDTTSARDLFTVAADGSQSPSRGVPCLDDPPVDWSPVWSRRPLPPLLEHPRRDDEPLAGRSGPRDGPPARRAPGVHGPVELGRQPLRLGGWPPDRVRRSQRPDGDPNRDVHPVAGAISGRRGPCHRYARSPRHRRRLARRRHGPLRRRRSSPAPLPRSSRVARCAS